MAKALLSYSKDTKAIELVVPRGTKAGDLSGILKSVLSVNGLSRLPRGCTACTSGDHWVIREELPETIQVELEK
jgi:hypothetical protein